MPSISGAIVVQALYHEDRCLELEYQEYSLFQTSSMDSGHHGDRLTNKPAMRDDRISLLSDN